MNPTADQLRASGMVEISPGVWTRPKNLGAGGGVESRHADSRNPMQSRTVAGSEANSGSSVPPARAAKRLRQSSKPLLNKLEAEYCAILESIWSTVIKQGIRFRLGNGIWYKPDFFIMETEPKPTAFEVKGPHAFRGGFENLKVAAGIYPQIRWVLVWKDENQQWQEQEILP